MVNYTMKYRIYNKNNSGHFMLKNQNCTIRCVLALEHTHSNKIQCIQVLHKLN